MKVLRYADYSVSPWKNGGGTTREIARSPGGAADFLWRLSLADVSRSGPFSAYAGYDRMIMLLAGDGCRLAIAGGATHELVTPFEPYLFPGEADVMCTVLGSPAKDLNLMTRRGRASARWDVVAGPLSVGPAAAPERTVRLVVSLEGPVTIGPLRERPDILERWDAAVLRGTESVSCDGPSRLLSIEIAIARDP
jgi:environmental stress-induced protein Ves